MPDPSNPSVPVTNPPLPAPVSDPLFIASHQKMSTAMAESAVAAKQIAAAAEVQVGVKYTAAQVWLMFATAACEGKLTASSNDMALFADDMLAEFRERFPDSGA